MIFHLLMMPKSPRDSTEKKVHERIVREWEMLALFFHLFARVLVLEVSVWWWRKRRMTTIIIVEVYEAINNVLKNQGKVARWKNLVFFVFSSDLTLFVCIFSSAKFFGVLLCLWLHKGNTKNFEVHES